MTGIMDHKPRK